MRSGPMQIISPANVHKQAPSRTAQKCAILSLSSSGHAAPATGQLNLCRKRLLYDYAGLHVDYPDSLLYIIYRSKIYGPQPRITTTRKEQLS
jgi:hypothetical protein